MNGFEVLKKFRGAKQAGFTLLELMAVVVIIGILASIALPSYQGYVKKSRARAAAADLVALAAAVENEFQRKLTYPTALADVKTWRPAQGDFFTYAYSTDNTYTLSATGKGSMDGCTLTLQHNNARTASSAATCGFGSW